jgi:hypothetical protein
VDNDTVTAETRGQRVLKSVATATVHSLSLWGSIALPGDFHCGTWLRCGLRCVGCSLGGAASAIHVAAAVLVAHAAALLWLQPLRPEGVHALPTESLCVWGHSAVGGCEGKVCVERLHASQPPAVPHDAPRVAFPYVDV